MKDIKQHWNSIYSTKKVTEVSWYEPMPETSLELISGCTLEKDSAVIDIGGGDSFLAEFLLAREFNNITVLDISDNAIDRAKERLGEQAEKVKWIVADITAFEPKEKYDLWHDRAAFHFLTENDQIESYLQKLRQAVKPGGFVIIGTFSDRGPKTCSGLPVKQYSIAELQKLFSQGFENVNSKTTDHTTPSGEVQNFTFCSFQRKENE